MIKATYHQLAHDLDDLSIPRSNDVSTLEGVTFDNLPLHHETLRGLERCGFKRPSPVQLESISLGLCGFDLVVQSKAGTGKTCIFAVVALEALKFNPNNCAQTLILAPTREVAIQIHEVVSSIGSSYESMNCALCIGGVDVKQNRMELNKKSCQIVIGTPGRVKQLIELGILKVQQIELFVLDEADKLMDDQFKIQIDEIYKRLSADKQMIVTSATYPNELSNFLQKYMKLAKNVRLGLELRLEAIEEFYVDCKAGHSSKKNMENKMTVLKRLLNELAFSKCVVFTNFQARAPVICENLNNDQNTTEKNNIASYICAELSQSERCKVFDNFRNSNEHKVLISTDISARGIDIQDVDLVVNFDLPNDNSTYYHRIGRGGRFGQIGKAISIVSNDALDRALFQNYVLSDKINKMTL